VSLGKITRQKKHTVLPRHIMLRNGFKRKNLSTTLRVICQSSLNM